MGVGVNVGLGDGDGEAVGVRVALDVGVTVGLGVVVAVADGRVVFVGCNTTISGDGRAWLLQPTRSMADTTRNMNTE